MSKKTLYILGILLTILVGTFLYGHFYCKVRFGKKADKPVVEVASDFVLTGNGFNFSSKENFQFPVNGFEAVLPVGDSVNLGISHLKGRFDANPSQKLVLTGYCTPAETNLSEFPNLGMARANALKNYFVSQGIPSSAIEISGEIREPLAVQEGMVSGPARYELIPVEMKPGPLVLYYGLGQTGTILTPEQEQAVAGISAYLAQFPDAGLTITGYTDISGAREANMQIGMARAKNAGKTFIRAGVAESRLDYTSKGPDDPVGDNSTEEGREKNRRTEIKIK